MPIFKTGENSILSRSVHCPSLTSYICSCTKTINIQERERERFKNISSFSKCNCMKIIRAGDLRTFKPRGQNILSRHHLVYSPTEWPFIINIDWMSNWTTVNHGWNEKYLSYQHLTPSFQQYLKICSVSMFCYIIKYSH